MLSPERPKTVRSWSICKWAEVFHWLCTPSADPTQWPYLRHIESATTAGAPHLHKQQWANIKQTQRFASYHNHVYLSQHSPLQCNATMMKVFALQTAKKSEVTLCALIQDDTSCLDEHRCCCAFIVAFLGRPNNAKRSLSN